MCSGDFCQLSLLLFWAHFIFVDTSKNPFFRPSSFQANSLSPSVIIALTLWKFIQGWKERVRDRRVDPAVRAFMKEFRGTLTRSLYFGGMLYYLGLTLSAPKKDAVADIHFALSAVIIRKPFLLAVSENQTNITFYSLVCLQL